MPTKPYATYTNQAGNVQVGQASDADNSTAGSMYVRGQLQSEPWHEMHCVRESLQSMSKQNQAYITKSGGKEGGSDKRDDETTEEQQKQCEHREDVRLSRAQGRESRSRGL